MSDENQLNLNGLSERIENLDKTLGSFDSLLKAINDELHKKQNSNNFGNDDTQFSVLYMHKKILEA